MGKENTRTLKNFNGKKSSKKNSKSRKNRNGPSTTEEMRDILNSESENPMMNQHSNFMSKNKGLVQYEGEAPFMGMQNMGMQNMGMPNMGMQGMGMPNMGMPNMGMPNMQQMFSPGAYDPLMLQQIAPLQTTGAMAQSGMPGNLMTPSNMIGGISGFAHAGAPTVPQVNLPQAMPQMPNMTGGGYRNIPLRKFTLTRKLL